MNNSKSVSVMKFHSDSHEIPTKKKIQKINYLSLFSGIGAFESAMRNLQIPFNLVGYCEIAPEPAKAYSLIHNIPESKNYGDITKIDETKLPQVDFITYGFPCQDISFAGKQKGFVDEDGNKTRSGLFFDAARIIKATRPKVAIAENVKALVQPKFKAEFKTVLESLEDIGYNNYWSVLNALDYNVPQKRERVFIVSIRKDVDTGVFEFPKKLELKKHLVDYLEKDVDDKYFLTDTQLNNIFNWKAQQRPLKRILGMNSVCPTLTARGAGEYHSGMILLSTDFDETHNCDSLEGISNLNCRVLTERESFRIMGFKDSEYDAIKDHFKKKDIYKMAGNSIVVDVVEKLLCMLFDKDGKFSI